MCSPILSSIQGLFLSTHDQPHTNRLWKFGSKQDRHFPVLIDLTFLRNKLITTADGEAHKRGKKGLIENKRGPN